MHAAAVKKGRVAGNRLRVARHILVIWVFAGRPTCWSDCDGIILAGRRITFLLDCICVFLPASALFLACHGCHDAASAEYEKCVCVNL
jgi:hypothetical protein